MQFNTFPWQTSGDTISYQLGIEANLIDAWLRKEGFKVPHSSSKKYILNLNNGTLTFNESVAFFEGSFSPEELLSWQMRFNLWDINYSNRFEFLINEYKELDNEIFFDSFIFDADIFLSEVIDYLPSLEAKGLVFDFTNVSESSDPTKFVLEDSDSFIKLISLEQRSKERHADHIVSELMSKTELPEAKKWLHTIYLGHIVTKIHDENEISHILDYFNSSEVDVSQIGATSYEEMVKRADKWIIDFNKKIFTKIGREGKDHKTLFVSPQGYTLLKLISDDAKKMEGKEMENCIGRNHLGNDNIYSVRVGDSRVASLDVRLHHDSRYITQEVKGFDNKAVPTEHWAGVRECLTSYFNINFRFSRDLYNVGWKVYYINPELAIVLESHLNVSEKLFDLHYYTPEEITQRKKIVLEQVSDPKIVATIEQAFIDGLEAMALCPYTNCYLTKDQVNALKDYEEDFTAEEIAKLAFKAYGPKESFAKHAPRSFISESTMESALGLKRGRTTLINEVFVGIFPLEYNLPRLDFGEFYLESEIRHAKNSLQENLRGKNKTMIQKLEDHCTAYFQKTPRCPYTGVFLKLDEHRYIQTLFDLEQEDKALFTKILLSLDNAEGLKPSLEKCYLKERRALNSSGPSIKKNVELYLKNYFNSQIKELQKVSEGETPAQRLEKDQREKFIRSFTLKIAKLYLLDNHPKLYQFLTDKINEEEWIKPRFDSLASLVDYLVPSYTGLDNFIKELKNFKMDLPDSMTEQDGIAMPSDIDTCSYCNNNKIYSDQEVLAGDIDAKVADLNEKIHTYNDYLNVISQEIDILEEYLNPLYNAIQKTFTLRTDLVNKTYTAPNFEELRPIFVTLDKVLTKLKNNQEDILGHNADLNDALDNITNTAEDIDDLVKEISKMEDSYSRITGESCDGDENGEDACEGESILDKNAKVKVTLDSCPLDYRKNNIEAISGIREDLYNLVEQITTKELMRELLPHWAKILKK